MKIKLDENISRAGIDLVRAAGHDVATVSSQSMGGISDVTLFDVCRSEGRVLVTLDHDFGNVLRFPPDITAGIAGNTALLARLTEFLAHVEREPVTGQLWIVEVGRLRIHLSDA